MKQDSSWRKILDKLLPEFLAFYFPKIHQAVDFDRGFEFLDKELQKILPQQDDTGESRSAGWTSLLKSTCATAARNGC